MRVSRTSDGLTVRIIAGTSNVLIGIDLEHDRVPDCLGFSIQRTDLDPEQGETEVERWLPNKLDFPDGGGDGTTYTAPLQKFRWGDYTCKPGKKYRYRVIPRYGTPGKLRKPGANDGVALEVTTETNDVTDVDGQTAVIFNRGAAASSAFNDKFGSIKTEKQLLASPEARAWLSRGLEEALLAFLARAENGAYALHASIYEFHKPELIDGLVQAKARKADIDVVIHGRVKNAKDHTTAENRDAIPKPLYGVIKQRKANPQSAIMHNKFVVLLKGGKPIGVWTGSTNWTDGAIYGQLNVGHAINDHGVAAKYEAYFQILKQDLDAEDTKHAVEAITPVSHLLPVDRGTTPIFSPQSEHTMIELYAAVCAQAKTLLVCAPFALSPIILKALAGKDTSTTLRYMLLDKEASLGKGPEVRVIENDPANSIGIAATLHSKLQDMQGKLLEDKEAWRHAGIHIHAKLIVADPFGSNPTIIMGSANFSNNSTSVNDSNSLIFRGQTALADIYATEFMRMFEHYHFRAAQARAETKLKKQLKPKTVLALAADDSWSERYYRDGSREALDRMTFAGTLH